MGKFERTLKKAVIVTPILFSILLVLQICLCNANSMLVAGWWQDGENRYGGSQWTEITAALDREVETIDVVRYFDDLDLMLQYDSLWLDVGWRSLQGSCRLLSQTGLDNISAFIETGRRVVMIGEWGDAYGYSYAADWNRQILGIVGGTFAGTPDEMLTKRLYPAISHELTNGIEKIYAYGDSFGIANGGLSLFDWNVATLWGQDNNVLTILNTGFFHQWLAVYDTALFGENVAKWIGTIPGPAPVPEPATLLLLGSGLVVLITTTRRKIFK